MILTKMRVKPAENYPKTTSKCSKPGKIKPLC